MCHSSSLGGQKAGTCPACECLHCAPALQSQGGGLARAPACVTKCGKWPQVLVGQLLWGQRLSAAAFLELLCPLLQYLPGLLRLCESLFLSALHFLRCFLFVILGFLHSRALLAAGTLFLERLSGLRTLLAVLEQCLHWRAGCHMSLSVGV